MIDKFTSQFVDERIEHEKIGRSYYLIPEDLKEVAHRGQPFAAGLFLGEEKGKVFMPSASLMDWISERVGKERKVYLNKKTEWLFLCGRDVFGEGIIKAGADVEKWKVVLVQNERDECLGYGKVVEDFGKKGKVVVKNLFDKGNFLRQERK